MGLILRIVLISTVLGGIVLGKFGLGGGSVGSTAVGVLGILLSIVALTVLLKFLWRFIGCFSTILLAIAAIVALLFLTGTFEPVANMAKSLLGLAPDTDNNDTGEGFATGEPAPSASVNYIPVVDENGNTVFVATSAQNTSSTPLQQAKSTGTFTGPIDKIYTGGQFTVGNLNVVLYGIDVPDKTQVCSDKRGQPYNCGQEAIRQLSRFTGETPLNCKVKAGGNRENLVYAVCNIDNYDLGVAMVQEGWAFALPAVTNVYVSYEEAARAAKKGMWAGQFYRPAEWRAKEAAARKAAQKSSSFLGGLF